MQLPAGRFQHPLTDRHNQTGFLSQRDKARGRYHPLLGVAPTHQNLRPEQALLLIDLGLVVHQQLRWNGAAQSVFKLHACKQLVLHALVKHHRLVFALLLGFEHGQLGALEHVVCRDEVIPHQRHTD